MRHCVWGLLCLCAATLVPACASAPRHTPAAKPQRASEAKPYDFRTEGTLPPAAGDSTPVEADIEEIPIADRGLEVTDAEAPPRDTLRTPAPADSMTDGFRVQVFASSDRDVAAGAADAARERLGVPAYVELESGMYKVRVGDYVRRADADAALVTMRRHYYPDAWVVPSRVRVPRSP